jgi:hypothetical protein
VVLGRGIATAIDELEKAAAAAPTRPAR